MKLRVQGNSVRLRLSRSEVAHLEAAGKISDCVDFGPGARLAYSVETAHDVRSLCASYDGGSIRVVVPSVEAQVWAETDQVSMCAEQDDLQILIEKDFKCIHKPDEENADAYPNPLQD